MRLNIGELLLKESLITSRQLQAAQDHHGRHGGTLSRAFVTLGSVKDRDIASLLSVHCRARGSTPRPPRPRLPPHRLIRWPPRRRGRRASRSVNC